MIVSELNDVRWCVPFCYSLQTGKLTWDSIEGTAMKTKTDLPPKSNAFRLSLRNQCNNMKWYVTLTYDVTGMAADSNF